MSKVKCSKCGDMFEPYDPRHNLCRKCFSAQSGTKTNDRTAESSRVDMSLPKECIFDTFYGEDGCLKQELFFEAPKKVVELFYKKKQTPSSFRRVYNAFQKFVSSLECDRINFSKAREQFSNFYLQHIIRQYNRGVITDVLKDLIDKHREVALKSREEMIGLFRYVKNILCYFDTDKEQK